MKRILFITIVGLVGAIQGYAAAMTRRKLAAGATEPSADAARLRRAERALASRSAYLPFLSVFIMVVGAAWLRLPGFEGSLQSAFPAPAFFLEAAALGFLSGLCGRASYLALSRSIGQDASWMGEDRGRSALLSAPRLENDRQDYDIFISYKSRDADLARFLAEQLFARGLRPWFAEYSIMAREFFEFRSLIERGIDHSLKALIISNDDYAASPYCIDELIRILGRLEPGQILEIRAPGCPALAERFPALAEARKHDYVNRGRALEEVEDFLGMAHRGFIDNPDPPSLRRLEYKFGLGFFLDLGGWEEAGGHRNQIETGNPLDAENGIYLYRHTSSPGLLRLVIRSGLQTWTHARPGRVMDDRLFLVETGKMVNLYQKYAAHGIFGRKILMESVGTHFLKIGETGHPFFGNRMQVGGRIQWNRQYVITAATPPSIIERVRALIPANELIKHPELGSELEFGLQFGVQSPSFSEYCAYGHIMDRVAASFRIDEGLRDVSVPEPAFQNNDLKTTTFT
jgi:hypothetical protein